MPAEVTEPVVYGMASSRKRNVPLFEVGGASAASWP